MQRTIKGKENSSSKEHTEANQQARLEMYTLSVESER